MTRRITVETAQVVAGDRLACWSDALAAVCGRLHADPLGARTLDGTMMFGEVGRLLIGRIAASRHRVGLTPALARTEPHAVAKVIVQTIGTSTYEQAGELVALGPGECIAYDVSQPHMITSAEHSEHLVVIIPHELVAERGVRLDSLHAQRFSATSGVGRLGAALIESTLAELDTITPICEADLATAILNLVFLPLAGASHGRDSMRYRIKSYIREHIRNPALSIDELARAFHCSKRTLHLAFTDCDQTIADFIRATRLDGCRAELEHRTDRSISEVAFAWGFASSAHFSRLFRQRFGFAPSSLR
ncbi:MAG TPA: helix-turn-helix domain-containing protein [Kofleriaceae bacterium]